MVFFIINAVNLTFNDKHISLVYARCLTLSILYKLVLKKKKKKKNEINVIASFTE